MRRTVVGVGRCESEEGWEQPLLSIEVGRAPENRGTFRIVLIHRTISSGGVTFLTASELSEFIQIAQEALMQSEV